MSYRRARRLMLTLVVLLTAGACAASTATPAPSGEPASSPGGGSIVFGMAISADSHQITAPSETFPRAYAGIVWFIASFREAPDPTALTVTLARQSGDAEVRVWSHPAPIPDPPGPKLADGRSLAELGALQPGTYVMRVMQATTSLAEGRFEVR